MLVMVLATMAEETTFVPARAAAEPRSRPPLPAPLNGLQDDDGIVHQADRYPASGRRET